MARATLSTLSASSPLQLLPRSSSPLSDLSASSPLLAVRECFPRLIFLWPSDPSLGLSEGLSIFLRPFDYSIAFSAGCFLCELLPKFFSRLSIFLWPSYFSLAFSEGLLTFPLLPVSASPSPLPSSSFSGFWISLCAGFVFFPSSSSGFGVFLCAGFASSSSAGFAIFAPSLPCRASFPLSASALPSCLGTSLSLLALASSPPLLWNFCCVC